MPPGDTSPLAEPASLCYKCIELNLPPDQQCKELRINCTKCVRPYGEHHASILDIRYCTECLPENEFDVTRMDYVRAGVEQTQDASGKITRRPYSTKCKQIILFGQDWLFSEIKISEMSQEQLEKAIEWHKAHVSLMEVEITRHKIEKAHKLASVKIALPDRNKRLNQEKKEKQLKTLAASLSGNLKPEELIALIQKLQGA